ncbi:MAG: hypothetical protein GX811_09330, partial [Lentisphaerae bacterium]|nr:hypothetical protein [Lentisphaerota bacterium]
MIPGGLTIYPTINERSRSITGIEVEPGASLNLGGYDLTVNGEARFYGSVLCESDETLSLRGDTDWTGGSFQSAFSTIIIDGDSAQSFTPDGLSFYEIIIENSSTVTFTGGFTAYSLLAEPAPGESRSIVFPSGELVTLEVLSLLSPIGTTLISLRSSDLNQFWNLSVNKGYSIRGVDVCDSDARFGEKLFVSGSLDSGNNMNWDFDQSWIEWTGEGGNGRFDNTANWYPSVVPGADDMVRIAGSQVITSLSPVTIKALSMGCGRQNSELIAYAELNVLNNLYLLDGSTMALNRPSRVDGNAVIFAGGTLTHSINSTVESNRLNVAVGGDMTIYNGASVDVKGKGYATSQGPGGTSGVNGGSYGGRGHATSKLCYGSIMAPTNIGSGGGYGGGGGAIRLAIAGQLVHNGIMNAEPVTAGHPTGAAGSIWLTFASLYGAGVINANGVVGGGGGRISLTATSPGYDLNEFNGIIVAEGAVGTTYKGGGGTIYLENVSDGFGKGKVIVEAGGGSGSNYTDFNTNVVETIFHKLVFREGGHFAVATNHHIEVSGVWSNAALFTGLPGATVSFTDRYQDTSKIFGGVFVNLVATNHGVHLEFDEDSTNVILPNGSVTMMGKSESERMLLRSSTPGESWIFHVDPSASQNIWCVDVQDSDASSGAPVTAILSQDTGNNKNWLFNNYPPGIVNRWTGAENNLWNNSDNWHSGREPYPEDLILIPGGLSIYPTINERSRSVAGIEVEPGASLNLGGYDLTVNGYAKFYGTLVCESDETLSFRGNTDWTGGSFQPAFSKIIIDGDSPQSFTPDGLLFYEIIIENPSAVTFTGGFTACFLFVEPAPGESRSLVFRSGELVTLEGLSLLSPLGTCSITLRSSTLNQFWNLSVNKGYTIRGVDVRDSDARFGEKLFASGSLDTGNNMNWDFDQSWAEWTSGAGDCRFDNKDNWYPSVIPGAGDMLRIEGRQPVSIVYPVTIKGLSKGGGRQNSELTAFADLKVSNNVYLLSNSTLALNRPSRADGNVVIFAGGTLTHSINSTVESNKLNVAIGGDMTVFYGGSVDVAGKGFAIGFGPGGTGGVVGGSYGGRGGAGSGSTSKPCYGSILAPTSLGSGGGYARAGGAVFLTITGQLVHNGLMSGDSVTFGYPTGSGGSIWLTFASLFGEGVIRAN